MSFYVNIKIDSYRKDLNWKIYSNVMQDGTFYLHIVLSMDVCGCASQTGMKLLRRCKKLLFLSNQLIGSIIKFSFFGIS